MKILKKNKLNLKLYPNPEYIFGDHIVIGLEDTMEKIQRNEINPNRIICKLIYSQFIVHKNAGFWSNTKMIDQLTKLKFYSDSVLS